MKFFRLLKLLVLSAAALLAAFVAVVWAFMNFSPEFGATQSKGRVQAFEATGHYADGKFQNQAPTDMSMRMDRLMPMLRRYYLTSVPDKRPPGPLPMVRPDSAVLADKDTAIARVTWFGHSALLLEVGGKKILFDPMFGQVPAPASFLSTARFNPEHPIAPEALPNLDAIVVSHDHYDHLDRGSILKLMGKTERFYAPLGVGAHLERWGVEGSRIRELDWGDSTGFEGVSLFCAPARHFSGRSLRDNSSTLWASWVIKAGGRVIYFSGDSGYGPHFRELGRRHGPFDLALMECGQYDREWPAIHMRADEAVQAARELGAKLMVPIHWGAFALALHAWYEPAQAVSEKARVAGLPVAIPRIGEAVPFGGNEGGGALPDSVWWPTGKR